MARLRRKGPSATLLARDEDCAPMPIMPWGKAHNVSATEAAAARNTAAISSDCGVVSIIAIGGAAHFKQGDASVVATTSDVYLPEGVWLDLPLFEGNASSYISFLSAFGSGDVAAQICERQ